MKNKKIGTLVTTRTVGLANIAAAVLLVIAWLLPMVKIYGEALSLLKMADILGGSAAEEVMTTFWLVEIICGISIIWAVIPKKWAAIVGMIYSIFPMFLTIGQVHDWVARDYDLSVGAILAAPLSMIVFVLFIVKLVVLLKAKKQNQTNVGANQPPMA